MFGVFFCQFVVFLCFHFFNLYTKQTLDSLMKMKN